MWIQINMFLSGLGKNKRPISVIKDKHISNIILQKTNTKIEYIKISESDYLFGMMVGIPGNPQLILSRKLYETFDPDELEYVLLHEAGHYQLAHSVKELLYGLMLGVIGVFILIKYPNTIFALFLGLFFGIVMVQIGRYKEIQADRYSLKRMANPEGMIIATEKLKKAWHDKSSKNPIVRLLFYRGNPYENRIKMAEAEIQRRAN